MNARSLAIVAAVEAIAAAIGFAIIRAVHYDGTSLCFVVAAILASWTGYYLAHRRAIALTLPTTAQLGLAIAAACIVVGVTLHFALNAFASPDIELPIAAAGSFVFPFVLRGSAVKAFTKRP